MTELWKLAWETYVSGPGGWIYLCLAALGIFLYAFALGLWWEVRHHPLQIERTGGWVAEAMAFVRAEGDRVERVRERFQRLHAALFLRVDRRLRYIVVLVSAAPLLGLLGTILGMTETFQVIAMGGSGVLERMAGGIGTALLSTQIGLVLALPGTLAVVAIRRQRDRLEANLMVLETNVISGIRRPGGMS